jgi:hypothetical protein
MIQYEKVNIVGFSILIFFLIVIIVFLSLSIELELFIKNSNENTPKSKAFKKAEAKAMQNAQMRNNPMMNTGWYGYRIGDLVLYSGTNNIHMAQDYENIMRYHVQNFPNSIGGQYVKQSKAFFRHRDFETFFNVCDQKCPGLMQKLLEADPHLKKLLTEHKEETAVVHLRLGDAVSDKRAKKATGVTPATYVHVAEMLHSKGIKYAVVVCGIHIVPKPGATDKSAEAYRKIKSFFDAKDIEVYMVSNDPDTDFCLISGAQNLVYCSKSGMSLLAGKRCNRKNNYCFNVMDIQEERENNKNPFSILEAFMSYSMIKQGQ